MTDADQDNVARISLAADVFTLLNTFHTSRERQPGIIASLRAFTETIARDLPGFVGASVHASLDGARVVNYVQWRSKADLDSMLALPAAQAHMAEVAALADVIDPVPYSVAFVSAAVELDRPKRETERASNVVGGEGIEPPTTSV